MRQSSLKAGLIDGQTFEETVYKTIKNAIYSGRFSPGIRLVEASLANELNVGRTPVREAIRMLAAEGLVKIVPNRGATVVKLSPEDIEEMYVVGGVLEGIAASIAVEKLGTEEIDRLKELNDRMKNDNLRKNYVEWISVNHKFHHIFLKGSQRPILIQQIAKISSSLPRYWYLGCTLPGLLETSIASHEKIVRAFTKKDALAVRAAAEEHLFIIGKIIKEHLKKVPII